jgi:hypothetical protein
MAVCLVASEREALLHGRLNLSQFAVPGSKKQGIPTLKSKQPSSHKVTKNVMSCPICFPTLGRELSLNKALLQIALSVYQKA